MPRCKLDSSARLIAPPHSLRLPTLEGVRTRVQFSTGTEAVLPLARLLINQGLLVGKHLEKATSPADAIQAALTELSTAHSEMALTSFRLNSGSPMDWMSIESQRRK